LRRSRHTVAQSQRPGKKLCRVRAIIAAVFGRSPAGDKTLFSIIQAAGWPIWPLILCSIVALALIIERFSSLRTVRVAPPKLLEEVVSVSRQNLPSTDVVSELSQSSVLGSVLASGLRTMIADPRPNEAALRNVFETNGRAAVHRLER